MHGKGEDVGPSLTVSLQLSVCAYAFLSTHCLMCSSGTVFLLLYLPPHLYTHTRPLIHERPDALCCTAVPFFSDDETEEKYEERTASSQLLQDEGVIKRVREEQLVLAFELKASVRDAPWLRLGSVQLILFLSFSLSLQTALPLSLSGWCIANW